MNSPNARAVANASILLIRFMVLTPAYFSDAPSMSSAVIFPWSISRSRMAIHSGIRVWPLAAYLATTANLVAFGFFAVSRNVCNRLSRILPFGKITFFLISACDLQTG